MPECDRAYVDDRTLRQLYAIPLFRNPKVYMMPVKLEKRDADGSFKQAWFPWQVCTNCLAGRVKGKCSHFHASLRIQQPLRVHTNLMEGDVTDDDIAYGWFTEVRDVGYTEPWLGRDGEERWLVWILLPFCIVAVLTTGRLMSRGES